MNYVRNLSMIDTVGSHVKRKPVWAGVGLCTFYENIDTVAHVAACRTYKSYYEFKYLQTFSMLIFCIIFHLYILIGFACSDLVE